MRQELLINIIGPSIIIPLGTIGNGLALWTLLFSKILRKRISSMFLIVLYLADESSLLTGYLVQWIINIFSVDVSSLLHVVSREFDNETGIELTRCAPFEPFVILFSIHYASFTISAFVMAGLTFERLLAVYKPFLSFTLNSHKEKVAYFLAFLALAAVAVYFPMPFRETGIYWNSETGNLDLDGDYPVWSLSVSMLFTFCVIFPLNIAILYKLHVSSQLRQVFANKESLKRSASSSTRDSDEAIGCMGPVNIDVKMTIILIGISVAFIVLTIPHRILVVYSELNGLVIQELPVAITRHICHVNFAINSIFYFFVASECREELRISCKNIV